MTWRVRGRVEILCEGAEELGRERGGGHASGGVVEGGGGEGNRWSKQEWVGAPPAKGGEGMPMNSCTKALKLEVSVVSTAVVMSDLAGVISSCEVCGGTVKAWRGRRRRRQWWSAWRGAEGGRGGDSGDRLGEGRREGEEEAVVVGGVARSAVVSLRDGRERQT